MTLSIVIVGYYLDLGISCASETAMLRLIVVRYQLMSLGIFSIRYFAPALF